MKKTFDAVTKLINTSRFLTNTTFPNSENEERCRRSLALIADLTERIIAEDENISSVYLNTLKQNFTKYMKSENTDIPKFLLSKRSIAQIICHLNDKEIYDYQINQSKNSSDTEKFFFLLQFASTSKDLENFFSVCLLKFYYNFYDRCSDIFILSLREYLDKYYGESYYLHKKDFIPIYLHNDSGESNYSEFLRNIKINLNFISTKFFQSMWSVWCLTRKASSYTEEFLKNNKSSINSEREDLRKCILAVITYNVNKLSSRDFLITSYLIPMFGSADPTNKVFWEISSQKLKNTYFKILQEVPNIYGPILNFV